MYEEALELLMPVVVVVLYTAAATLFAGLGLLFEYKSYLFLSGGELFIGLWAAGVGLLALSASYYLTNDKLSQAFGALRE